MGGSGKERKKHHGCSVPKPGRVPQTVGAEGQGFILQLGTMSGNPGGPNFTLLWALLHTLSSPPWGSSFLSHPGTCCTFVPGQLAGQRAQVSTAPEDFSAWEWVVSPSNVPLWRRRVPYGETWLVIGKGEAAVAGGVVGTCWVHETFIAVHNQNRLRLEGARLGLEHHPPFPRVSSQSSGTRARQQGVPGPALELG